MKWKTEIELKPFLGEKRIIKKFLWLPVCIGDEVRWLEKAEILQKYNYTEKPEGSFINVKWINA